MQPPWKSRFPGLLCSLSFCLFVPFAPPLQGGEPEPSQVEGGEPVWISHPGPWGELEVRSLYLEAPDSLVAGLKQPSSTTAWNFPGGSEASIREVFSRAGLAAETITYLLDPQRILLHEGVWTVFADSMIVEALTTDQRSAIYTELARTPLNHMHQNPAYVVGNNADDWLREAHLSDTQKETVKKLLWHDGDLLAFSDVSVLLAEAHTDAEVRQVFKFMTRVRTLVVDVKLSHGQEAEAQARYWTADGRLKDNQPLLSSLEERSSMKAIDLTHLLPAMARRRIYTFPSVESAAQGRLPDCQWTSVNFFNSIPQDYFLDARITGAHLKEAYDTVQAPYQYGDILEFIDAHGNAMHACVYIADDIVFTKNGDGMIKPWLLMWLSNVENLYMRDPGMHITGYRLKQQTPS